MAGDTGVTVADAPGAWPLLGHLPQMWRGPLGFFTSLAGQGDVVRIRLGPLRAFVVCDPGLVQQMLREPGTFDKGGIFYDKARQIVPNGLGTCGWGDHQRQRPLAQPAFTRTRLESYVPVMGEEATAAVSSWRAGEPVDVVPQMGALFARITARTLFGSELGAGAIEDVQQALPVLSDGVYRRMTAPLRVLEKLPTPANRRYGEALARLRAVIDQVIAEHQATTADRGEATREGEAQDMLSALLAAREGGDRLSDAEVHAQAFTFLMAGVETTAITLSWTLDLLARDPDVQERMHTEIATVLDGRLPRLKDIPLLKYTRQILTETMRLYPAAWLVTRSATADTHLGGHPVPRGSTVVFSPYLLHHDARHFPDPERFDPDRWAPERSDQGGANALFPFGGGARKCIGDVFSLTEAVITVAQISARWHLTPGPGPAPKALAKTILTPDRFTVTPHPRPC